MRRKVLLILFFCCIPLWIHAQDVSICDVNQHIGVVPGDLVQITGICTVPSERLGNVITILTQDGGGPWCSIAVYDQEEEFIVQRGQCATITGVVSEYYGKNEIVLNSVVDIWECGWFLPDPLRMSPPVDLDAHVSSVCVWEGLTITTEPDEYGRFGMVDVYDTDWTGLFLRGDPVPPVGTEICSMTAMLDYSFNSYVARPLDSEYVDYRTHDDCPWLGTTCDDVTIRAFLSPPSADCFVQGDTFLYTVTWTNLCHARNAMLFVALNVADFWFFFPINPSENSSPHAILETGSESQDAMLPELGSLYTEVFEFQFPGVLEELSCGLYALALDATIFQLIGPYSEDRFCLH